MITNLISVTLAILVQVESQGHNNRKGDHGRATGLYQMHVCMVDDINRLYHTHFKHSDRTDPWKAHQMATLWLKWATEHYHISDPTHLAYRWNHPATGKTWASYRRKVAAAFVHLSDELVDVPI